MKHPCSYRTHDEFRDQYDIPMSYVRIVEEGKVDILSDSSALQWVKSYRIVICDLQPVPGVIFL